MLITFGMRSFLYFLSLCWLWLFFWFCCCLCHKYGGTDNFLNDCVFFYIKVLLSFVVDEIAIFIYEKLIFLRGKIRNAF